MHSIEAEESSRWLGSSRNTLVAFQSSWRMFILTASIGGLQMIWSTITSNVTPLLLSLGFSKSATAIVWSIAPICGALIQPYFGMVSDQCQNVLGRRKPFMLGGAIAVSVSLLGFALSESITYACLDLFSLDLSTHTAQMAVEVAAVFWFCALHVSIQPLQVASRAFIVEGCASDEQFLANAWASRLQGAGSITGFLLGSVSLPLVLPYGRMPEFSTLCLVVSILLLGTVLLSCILVPEESNRELPATSVQSTGLSAHVAILLSSIRRMPKPVRKICYIQCFAWMGWFPFLMYYTTYISRIYQGSISPAGLDQLTVDNSLADAMRVGSLAGFFLALFAFIANLALPTAMEALGLANKTNKETPRHLQRNECAEIPDVTLVYVWMFAHVYFAIAMFLTLFVTSWMGSMALVASVGISWAISLWIPYSLLGVLLSNGRQGFQDCPESGIVLGLHNAAVSAPQILSALISSAVFTIYDDSGFGIVWNLRIGGCWAVVAAGCSWKLIMELSFP